MSLLGAVKNRFKFLKQSLTSNKLEALQQQNIFLMNQISQINEKLRYMDMGEPTSCPDQTSASFDYQWKEVTDGNDLPSDQGFIKNVSETICSMARLPSEWFQGKKVLDAGCGMGRFTYGLLQMGAHVTACDQSAWAIKHTQGLCHPFKNNLEAITANLLYDKLPDTYDLVFSFGVVHHTGNTYLAIKNICKLVKPGGKLFLMVYGFPEKREDFTELNAYETLRFQLHGLSFSEKIQELSQRFPKEQVHGWFDAVSPEINDLLTYHECVKLLKSLGFEHIQRTVSNRNLHITASRIHY
jgi:2-polyprenyl-3-methyl-5-hydroxy-6-metoxy-1,4-benzoquinol methylase